MSQGVYEGKIAENHALGVFRSSLMAVMPYLNDDDVQEVMINKPNDVWVESFGEMKKVPVVLDGNSIESAIRALASANGRAVTSVLDCRMPGFRVAAVIDPVGINGPAICIRKHGRGVRPLDSYLASGGFDAITAADYAATDKVDSVIARPSNEQIAQGGQGLYDFFRWAVHSRKNLMIAGSTGSGKTTFLNALLQEIPADQRVLTIEDTAELQVSTPNAVALESAPESGVTIRSLVRLALRFRPDRIVVGEVRGPESYDLLDAMNTGHSGGACSMHADSPELALSRMESMVRMNPDASNLPHRALVKQIAETFDFVIFCSRRGKRRGPEQVLEVLGAGSDGYETNLLFDARKTL